MKKSTKILVVAFITVVLMITAVHLALSARYKNGVYTAYKTEEVKHPKTAYPGVKNLTLQNLGDVVMSIGDTAAVGIHETANKEYTITQQGNVLVIAAKNPTAVDRRFRGKLWVTVPNGAIINAKYTDVQLEQKAGTAAGSFTAMLDSSQFRLAQYKDGINLDSVSIQGSNGSKIWVRNAAVRSINIRLQTSSFEEKGSMFGSVQVAIDTTSSLSLTGRNVVNTTIVKQ